MINMSTIMKQVEDWLGSAPLLDGHVIERSEFVNEDPGRAINGWIGIYRRGAEYEPRHLGIAPNNYDADIRFSLIVQRAAMLSGEEAEDALEESVKAVLDRMVQIPKTYIDHIMGISVEYTYLESSRTTMYFQGALITFTAEVSSEVT